MPTLEERVEALELHLADLTKAQQAADADVAKLPESLMVGMRVIARGLNARMDGLDTRMTWLEQRLEQRFERLEQRMERLEQRFDRVEARFDTFADDMAAVLKILGGRHGPAT
jgi:chaperonin cofactor prefoldin